MNKSTIIVSFSSRKDGNCSTAAKIAADCYEKPVKIYRFEDFTIQPCGACAYECFLDGKLCPYYKDMEAELLAQISDAKEAVFIVPNYCDHPCANFYTFNERSNCWFQNRQDRLEQYLKIRKKFIVISNTKSDSFQRAFQQHTEDELELLYLSSKQHGIGNSTAYWLQNAQAQAEIRNFLKERPEGG